MNFGKAEYEKNLAGKKATDKLIEKNVQEYIDAVSDMDDIYEKVRIVYDKPFSELSILLYNSF